MTTVHDEDYKRVLLSLLHDLAVNNVSALQEVKA